jgi:hypothetical protein
MQDAWNRFVFTICLEDYAFKLNEKKLWLAARFAAGGAAGVVG